MHSTDAGQFTQYVLDVCCHMPKNNIVLQLVLLGTDLMMCNAFKFISSVFSVTEDLSAAILPQISYCLSNSTKVPLQLKTEISQGWGFACQFSLSSSDGNGSWAVALLGKLAPGAQKICLPLTYTKQLLIIKLVLLLLLIILMSSIVSIWRLVHTCDWSYQKRFLSLLSLGIALIAQQERLVSTNFVSFIWIPM